MCEKKCKQLYNAETWQMNEYNKSEENILYTKVSKCNMLI